ncbi:MAG: arginine--tRNA ligase [Actinomycetales bacterium]|nr:arginine--tRNA ligase [Candidatus Phosphoribacter baldrii]
MPSPHDTLAPLLSAAIATAFGDEHRDADPVLRPSQFADLQANFALPLAKRLGMPPREIASRVVAELDLAGVCSGVDVSGPGFVNLTLADSWIASAVRAVSDDPRLGVAAEQERVVVLDYSAPNVAKEMHVGHLRTTVVGDALARTLEHLGHNVIRQNHVGDWGANFGMLVEHLLAVGEGSEAARLVETDPNAFYQAARDASESDPEVMARARARALALQERDPETVRLWTYLVDLAKHYFNGIYAALDITLTDADLAGESTYNDALPGVCAELEAKGIATVSDGALCVFLPEFTGREGKPVPLIVRKSDGGYGYATTDLATIRHRVEDLGADRVLYVVGAPQSLHFQMIFATARVAGWLPDDVQVVHVQIGNVLGEDRKILRTREGKALRLGALVDEAVDAARGVLDEARPDLDPGTRHTLARQIGVGAIKYADLSVAHDSEYVFDLARMVSLTGNTGPYVQYAAARVRSIFRSAGVQIGVGEGEEARRIVIGDPAERALALALLEFGSVVRGVGSELEPHRLCAYLFDLAQTFSAFYEACPVLKAPDAESRESRLGLCATTFRVMEQGLALLGIATPDQM